MQVGHSHLSGTNSITNVARNLNECDMWGCSGQISLIDYTPEGFPCHISVKEGGFDQIAFII